MNSNNREKSTFHTDQGRWDRRDYENDNWSQFENNNMSRDSLLGHVPDELSEGEALDYREDEPIDFQKEYSEQEGHLHSDKELERVINDLFRSSKQLHDEEIKITVCKGDVLLSGKVKSEEKRSSATSLTELIHGVGQIRNKLVVKNDELRSGYARKENNQEGPATQA